MGRGGHEQAGREMAENAPQPTGQPLLRAALSPASGRSPGASGSPGLLASGCFTFHVRPSRLARASDGSPFLEVSPAESSDGDFLFPA